MDNVGANILFLGGDKYYFVVKILTKSSVHLTAFSLQLLITSCASYISLSDIEIYSVSAEKIINDGFSYSENV